MGGEIRVYMRIDAKISAEEAAALLAETRDGAIVGAVAAAGNMANKAHEMVNIEFRGDHFIGDFEASKEIAPMLKNALYQTAAARQIDAKDERGTVEAVLQAEFSEAAARARIDPALITARVIGYGEMEMAIAEAVEALYG